MVILNCKNISEFYCFCCTLDQINAGLVSRRDFFKKKKHYKYYCSKTIELKEKTAHSVIISDFRYFDRVSSPSLSEPASASSSMEVVQNSLPNLSRLVWYMRKKLSVQQRIQHSRVIRSSSSGTRAASRDARRTPPA